MLEAFYADIKKYQNFIDPETQKESNWVGYFLKENRIDTDKIYSRGFLENCELNEDHVRVDCESAWQAIPTVWDLMAKKYNLSYVYISEEPSCEVYVNTDLAGRFFSTRYKISYYDDCDSETVYCDSFNEVCEKLGLKAKNMNELYKRLEGRNISVFEFAYE